MEKKKFKGFTPKVISICLLAVCLANIAMLIFGKGATVPPTLFDDYVSVEQSVAYDDIRGNVTSPVLEGGKLFYINSVGEKRQAKFDKSMGIALPDMVIRETKSSPNTFLIIATVLSLIALAVFVTIFVIMNMMAKKMMKDMVNGPRGAMARPSEDDVKIKKQVSKVRLSDVQGIDSIKAEIENTIDALKNPQAYVEIGARPKKGLLLCGAPGTGKTLTAKAIAGEAGVPFFSMNGSDFIEKYVGVGASRIRELYAEAKKNAPCIVFIDEIDAIGGQRGDSQNSERDQTINALLTEMDGFSGTEGILTIAATNRVDMLDTALTRPGRFDLTLTVNLPDKDGRLAILRQHSKTKKLGMEVDLQQIASRTVGFSGAALEALCNEAAHLAVRSKRKYILNVDFEDAFFKIIMKGSKLKRKDVEETTKLIAWHESGHALVTKLLTDDSVTGVTIIGSTSGAGGVTFMSPKENVLHSRKYLRNKVMVDYAGRAAEQLLLGDEDLVTTGASQDIKDATGLIRAYIMSYGMGQNGMLDMESFKLEKDIFTEASAMAKELYAQTLNLLTANKDTLKNIADVLVENETIDEETLNAVIDGSYHPPVNPTKENEWVVE